jgi:ferredoxin, 2Fe-2S
MDAPPAENNENTVEVTFLPEGKTVTFEHGKLPYKDHGKEESLLDVALNFGIPSIMLAEETAPARPATSG